MSASPPEHAAWFFKFYRQRQSNIQALAGLEVPRVGDFPGSLDPDRLVLAVTGLDSLAHHWERVYQIAGLSHRERLDRFLVEHGDADVFSRCSIVDLAERAGAEKRAGLLEALAYVPHARNPPATQRLWRQDPELQALAAHPAVVKSGVGLEWLQRSRYGQILYKQFRCPWVHELDGPGTEPPLFDVPEDEPRYDNRNGGRELVFPLPFLLKTFGLAIDSFEAQCAKDGKTP